jgi:quinol monooxygenase YgiN
MIIVAGHITVDPEQRESYLAGCMSVVEKARRADGCLDFAITADLLDPERTPRGHAEGRGFESLQPLSPIRL